MNMMNPKIYNKNCAAVVESIDHLNLGDAASVLLGVLGNIVCGMVESQPAAHDLIDAMAETVKDNYEANLWATMEKGDK